MTTSPDWLRASKKLVDPEALKPIAKGANEARSHLAGIRVPFPIQAVVFVPKEMISRVDEKLQCLKDEFDGAVSKLLVCYEDLRNLARLYLGDLFNEMDYPVDVRTKFPFA